MWAGGEKGKKESELELQRGGEVVVGRRRQGRVAASTSTSVLVGEEAVTSHAQQGVGGPKRGEPHVMSRAVDMQPS